MKLSLAYSLALAAAAYVPSEPFSTLTPPSPAPTGAATDYAQKFGILVVTLTQKRDVVNQIGDGQIQKQSAPAPTVVAQINDGQIQHQSVVNQIHDGQIQHQTVVAQIGDGQIQHQSVVHQIGDGQIQHQTATVASQIGDGQVQATGVPAPAPAPAAGQSCLTDNALTMTLEKSILKDGKGRIGAIVANRQFQFDGPPPQAGSIYAAGWSVTAAHLLALGNQTEFFQCKSGDFYNLYDENVAEQCEPVNLAVVDLVSC